MLTRAFLILIAGATAANAAPAHAITPFMASVSDTSCNGKTTCTLAFLAVASGKKLTIQHLSCSIVTKGETGSVSSFVLSTAGTGAGTPGDVFPGAPLVKGSNIDTSTAGSTLFYVSASDQPVLAITSGAAILGAAGNGCFISGTTTP